MEPVLRSYTLGHQAKARTGEVRASPPGRNAIAKALYVRGASGGAPTVALIDEITSCTWGVGCMCGSGR